MLFNSLSFLAFFAVVTTLYFLLPHKYRWIHLLAASVVFYMTTIPVYILVLAALILIDYTAGILIAKSEGRRRTALLLGSILSTATVLFVFKYFNFFNANLSGLAQLIGWNYSMATLNLLLPIGLSFHTFQSLSYVIEVYRKKQRVERHLGIYALYVLFYPQLVAGPIERPQHMLRQFRKKQRFEGRRVVDGLKLMLWGLFKKVVIADKLALIVNAVYAHPHDYTGTPLLIATVFFAIQIYADFSGYCDIAIGAAQVMGFTLMDNFDRPYSAKSISEFWRRWHISLSFWFRDYIYIPLGGNRVGVPRWYLNVMIVFLVSGLWHGADWTFVVWGGLHGLFIVVSLMSAPLRGRIVHALFLDRFPRIHAVLQQTIVFLLACIAWVFFRAETLQDALYILMHLFDGIGFNIATMGFGVGWFGFAYLFGLVAFLWLVHFFEPHARMRSFLSRRPLLMQWGICWLLMTWILLFGVFNNTKFIYFQF